ncbi:MAG: TlyA family RNA methyltransferase [Candidatus Nomurabacteria bacterium]|jgi:23S rRNA (cytidine1920-2'-O)/16S rRNA (cytidine1409-2'-O)-methyltransferase|nr:TlyA family RNA methyltransferase [Candidatus Nomurabacteria bacterium]
MAKLRLDQALVVHGLTATRSQATSYICLGKVEVNGRVVIKPGYCVPENASVKLKQGEQYVSRAGMKLASVAGKLKLDFAKKTVLDVGSSTGGFTDYALQHGAEKVVAVDVGTDQLHPKLRADTRVELHEKTDIRDFHLEKKPDIIVIDVSFISLREILPYITEHLAGKDTYIVAMVKPQFETGARVKNAGVVKNDTERRKILRDFETWARKYFIVKDKKDSEVAGASGNQERFYLLMKTSVSM